MYFFSWYICFHQSGIFYLVYLVFFYLVYSSSLVIFRVYMCFHQRLKINGNIGPTPLGAAGSREIVSKLGVLHVGQKKHLSN